MRPLLAPGDRVTIVPARADDVRPGDVVVLALDDDLVAHRLVYQTDACVVTRGDDAPACDPPAPLAAVVGRVDVPASPRALVCALRALLR